ncbi:hypothetical protein [Gordonia insulae]|uniref:Bacteriocin biosynthesis cyclodehydratase domain-containing protein n=1 Tax=Gordonia insulae TaxID=2420509 RepID=A0A3G8JWM0_9ACTN|nr:hypothetical protein [Gordonia insulae]AZG48590.1 hypothetical protein D7316_05207 [Gordonia insulae]
MSERSARQLRSGAGSADVTDIGGLPVSLPLVRPGTPVLVRPGNRVHVGSDPHRSLIIDLTPPVRAADVAGLLRDLTRPRSRAEMVRRARSIGLTPLDLAGIIGQLTAAGQAVPTDNGRSSSTLRIRIHGRGPLADLLTAALSEVGMVPRRSTRRPTSSAVVDRWDANLVVLTDFLVHDPAIINALNAARTAHLQVRVRDGVGVIGPLVLPGLSSCLRCADHHRATLEPDWPLLAAQMVRQPGYASAATLRGTAALAQEQIEQLAGALWSGDSAAPRPQLFDRALEFHPNPARFTITDWPPHPLCDCRPITAVAG